MKDASKMRKKKIGAEFYVDLSDTQIVNLVLFF